MLIVDGNNFPLQQQALGEESLKTAEILTVDQRKGLEKIIESCDNIT